MKRVLALSVIGILSLVMITGCSGSSEKATLSLDETDSLETKDTELFGTVQSVDGSEITLSLSESGGMGGGFDQDMPDMEGGDVPDMESGDMPEMESRDISEMESGDIPDMEDGERPEMGSGEIPDMSGMEGETGVTGVLTINDESILQIQDGEDTADGSLSDISEGTMLQITFDSDGNITSIIVVSMEFPGSTGTPGETSEESDGSTT